MLNFGDFIHIKVAVKYISLWIFKRGAGSYLIFVHTILIERFNFYSLICIFLDF